MHLFLTSVLPFLAHNHPSAVAFLTCRYHNLHSSIIPEFLSDDERVTSFCCTRQQNKLEGDSFKEYSSLYKLFIQTPLMQFSPSLVLCQEDSAESILKPLFGKKYFTRSLQRCTVRCLHSNDLLRGLSKVQSLIKLDLDWCSIENEHLEIIVDSFPSLETLNVKNARSLDPKNDISFSSPPTPATKSLRNLTMRTVNSSLAIQFVPHFPNLRKLELSPQSSFHAENPSQKLDLLPLTTSLPLLTDLSIERFSLDNIESLKHLVHLSSLQIISCDISDLSFLSLKTENSLSHLTKLVLYNCFKFSTVSFASLSHASNLQVLTLNEPRFNSDCLKYLENMVHLRKLDLSFSSIVGDSRSLDTLMKNSFQLEELNLKLCNIGNQGAIAGALYSTHSRLRVLNLKGCNLVDDDLNGIGALQNTLEVLDVSENRGLTNEALVHCKDLVKLKTLNLLYCVGINDLSPLKDCLNLEELDVVNCDELSDDSFQVFSEEPNSFPNLRVLNLCNCKKLTEKVFEHLSKNNHLVHQLKELNIEGMTDLLQSSQTARNSICQLKGLRRFYFYVSSVSAADLERVLELTQGLRNLEEQLVI